MDLVTPYREYFQVVLADTDALKAEAFRIRYRVYCQEFNWLHPARYPDGRERDDFDGVSLHCLLRHRPSKRYAGTVRLIRSQPDLGHAIPLLEHCPEILLDERWRPGKLQTGRFGEISRLALCREFRRRAGETATPDGQGTQLLEWHQDERRRFPHIALGLYLAASAIGVAQGLDGVYALMEPRLARHLRHGGIHFEQVGDAREFPGIPLPRAPCYISRQALFEHLSQPLHDLLVAIAEDLGLKLDAV